MTDTAADVAAKFDKFERAGYKFGEVQELKRAVLAEIKELQGELTYWTQRADAAWRLLVSADIAWSEARDRLRAEIRREAAANASHVQGLEPSLACEGLPKDEITLDA